MQFLPRDTTTIKSSDANIAEMANTPKIIDTVPVSPKASDNEALQVLVLGMSRTGKCLCSPYSN